MSLITDASTEWSAPVTLATDEVWQTRSGQVFLTTTTDPEAGDGIELVLREGIRLKAGSLVRYRKSGPGAALIVREAI